MIQRMVRLFGALIVIACLPWCDVARGDGGVMSGDPVEDAARREFSSRMGKLQDAGDWNGLLENGRQWQKSHPKDVNGWFTEARGAYFLGDVATAITAWEKSKEIEPAMASNAESWLVEARQVRVNFPNLKLQPLVLEYNEASKEGHIWVEKGRAVLNAEEYDEIERVAADLQKTNAARASARPHLASFFAGITSAKSDFEAQKKQFEAWREAKPTSILARLAQITMWTDAAWEARGTGFGDTITPEMSKRMDANLEQAAKHLAELPESAQQTPLTFERMMNWGVLTVGRKFLDEVYYRAIRKFPDYYPFYEARAYHLLPRWFGEPGEWELFLENRANQIGGENGDIFYARVLSASIMRYPNIFEDTEANYARVKRGLVALQKRRPDSTFVSNQLLRTAVLANDWKTAQGVLLGPNGHRIDTYWWTQKTIAQWAPLRMKLLSQ
ncbi:MAG TPA: DUF4034 domain-containing protein [Abditibacterium sp.]|jgi:hypothetical protein